MSDGGAQFTDKFLGSEFAGFTIDFFEAGTSTAKNVWLDETKSSAVQQISADSKGYARWFADGMYREVIKKADGTPLWDNPFVKRTSDTATMWEGNFGTTYPNATSANLFQEYLLTTAGNKVVELGFNEGNRFVSLTQFQYYVNSDAVDQGVDSDDGSIADIMAAIGTSDQRTIVLKPGTYQYSTDDTITSNITLDLQPGAILVIASGVTVTYEGKSIGEGKHQLFSLAGTGKITLANVSEVYPEWWGAVFESSPTSGQNTINKTAIQAMFDSSAPKFVFNSKFTVDDVITYPASSVISGGEGFHTETKGIRFKFTATGNTDLFSPATTSDKVVYKNFHLEIAAGSDLGTSGWTIVLHNHKGGRFTRMNDCFYENLSTGGNGGGGADNGGGNYYSVAHKRLYTASPQAFIFNTYIIDNTFSGFDTDLWVNGDDTVGAGLGLAVGWIIRGNFFASVATSNDQVANPRYANLRLEAVRQFMLVNNIFNGNGGNGTTGFPNITISDESQNVEIVSSYWEGGPSGRQKIIMNDETNRILIVDSLLTRNEILDNTDTGFGNYAMLGSSDGKFGGSLWSYDNQFQILNESRLQKAANYTLTSTDSGTTVWSGVDGVIFTLPATVAGLTFRIQSNAADGTVEISLSPNENDKIMGAQIVGTNNKDRINTKATAQLGDFIEVVGDGVDGWYVTEVRGTWAEGA